MSHRATFFLAQTAWWFTSTELFRSLNYHFPKIWASQVWNDAEVSDCTGRGLKQLIYNNPGRENAVRRSTFTQQLVFNKCKWLRPASGNNRLPHSPHRDPGLLDSSRRHFKHTNRRRIVPLRPHITNYKSNLKGNIFQRQCLNEANSNQRW